LWVVFIEFGEAAAETSVVDEDVYIAEVGGKICEGGLDLGAELNVEFEDMHGGGSGSCEGLLQPLETVEPSGAQEEMRALVREGYCGGFADAGAGAGDEYDLSLKR
jgi:hypothetical protein